MAEQERVYVGLIPTDDCQLRLNKYATENGFDISKGYGGNPFSFHLTIMVSTNKSGIGRGSAYLSTIISCKPRALALLGANADIPVIIVKDQGMRLEGIRYTFERGNKLVPNFPDFVPHVTLSYKWDTTKDLKAIPLPNFDIEFDRIQIEDFVEDVTESVTTKLKRIVKIALS